MDFINQLNLGTSFEILVIMAFCYCFTQLLKQTRINNAWLPWISMLIGVLAALLAGAAQNDTRYWSLIILGLLVGAATAGLFDGFKNPFVEYKSGKVLPTVADQSVKAPDKPVSAKWEPTNKQQNVSLKDEKAVLKDGNN